MKWFDNHSVVLNFVGVRDENEVEVGSERESVCEAQASRV